MGFQGKDGRWYATIQEREAANQRWEQTQLLKKQVYQQQEEARKQDRIRREQERILQEQARDRRRRDEQQAQLERDRNDAIREQNRLLAEQAMQEREDRRREREERKEAAAWEEIRNDVFPLLDEAGIKDKDAFLGELQELYTYPELHHYEIYQLKTIEGDLRLSLAGVLSKLSRCAEESEDRNLAKAAEDCVSLLHGIKAQIKSAALDEAVEERGGFFSAFRRSPRRSDRYRTNPEPPSQSMSSCFAEQEELLRAKANQIIQHFNEQVKKAADADLEKYDRHDRQIAAFEERRLQSFSNPRELALEILSDIEEKYIDEGANNYRLRHYQYPSEYEEYKSRIRAESRRQSGLDLFDGLDYSHSDEQDEEAEFEEFFEENDEPSGMYYSSGISDDPDLSLFDQAVAIAMRNGEVSATKLQRELMIGYIRAGQLMDKMEEQGIIGPRNSSGSSKCLIR